MDNSSVSIEGSNRLSARSSTADGSARGDALLEGLRPCLALASEVSSSFLASVGSGTGEYGLPAGYRSRPAPEYFNDSASVRGGVVWQPDVYEIAREAARVLGCTTIVDVGCGRAGKLMALADEFETIGIDFGSNLEWCRATYPAGRWISLDLESDAPLEIDEESLRRSLILCVDVIEHVIHPERLLRRLRGLLDVAPAALLSTPERDVGGGIPLGPPANPAHVREWSLAELSALVRSEGLEVPFAGLTRSNDRSPLHHTSLLLLAAGAWAERAGTAGDVAEVTGGTPPPPRPASASQGAAPRQREAGYSFCLITNGERPAQLRKGIDSIRALGLEHYEIVVGGEVPPGFDDVKVIPMSDAARAGRLGEMRNRLCAAAHFDRLIVADDDMLFHPGFCVGIEERGDDFDVLAARILNPDGSRFWDWAAHGPAGHRLLGYDQEDSDVYVTGGLIVMRSEVVNHVQWDEERGLYAEEDVDFSRRLREAGFRIRSCPESVATHDDPRYMQRGLIVLRRPIPRVPPRWIGPAGAGVLGVVMIVRNEAENLPDLFTSLADVADEVVVVDTGSTDGTQELCRAWGVTLVEEPWRDDFSRARNRSLAAASARFLLWLDGDDRLPAATVAELKRLRDRVLPSANGCAYVFELHNLNGAGGVIDVGLQCRLFARSPRARFRYPVHEQIADALLEAGVRMVKTGMVVQHVGYSDPAVVAAKVRRNEALLRDALRTRPNDTHLRVHLAQTLTAARRLPEAEAELTAVLEGPRITKVPPTLAAEYHVLRSTCRLLTGQKMAAIHDLERATGLHPEWGIPYSELARLRFESEEWESVVELAEAGRGRSFAAGVHNFRVVRSRSLLDYHAGRALRKLGDPAGAVECLHRAVAIDPTLLEARLELGDLQLEREEYSDALETLEPAGSDRAAIPHFSELATGIALARYMGGNELGAQACLAPLLNLFADQLGGSSDVDPMQLAEAALRAGHARAAKNLVTLFQRSLQAEVAPVA